MHTAPHLLVDTEAVRDAGAVEVLLAGQDPKSPAVEGGSKAGVAGAADSKHCTLVGGPVGSHVRSFLVEAHSKHRPSSHHPHEGVEKGTSQEEPPLQAPANCPSPGRARLAAVPSGQGIQGGLPEPPESLPEASAMAQILARRQHRGSRHRRRLAQPSTAVLGLLDAPRLGQTCFLSSPARQHRQIHEPHPRRLGWRHRRASQRPLPPLCYAEHQPGPPQPLSALHSRRAAGLPLRPLRCAVPSRRRGRAPHPPACSDRQRVGTVGEARPSCHDPEGHSIGWRHLVQWDRDPGKTRYHPDGPFDTIGARGQPRPVHCHRRARRTSDPVSIPCMHEMKHPLK